MSSQRIQLAQDQGSLRISEIFTSVQGETSFTGWPTFFIRLTGCPLRCVWCDSEYAFKGGEQYTVQELVQLAREQQVQHITVTGGEPLAQPNVHHLMRALCDTGLTVSLETSGAFDISEVDSRVHTIMDIKAPGSGEAEQNRWENLPHLRPTDELKVVIRDRADYEWTKTQLIERNWMAYTPIIWLSPSYQELSATDLANWVVEDRLPVRFQMQLHKELWGDKPGV